MAWHFFGHLQLYDMKIAHATRSGKTLAFGLPILHHTLSMENPDATGDDENSDDLLMFVDAEALWQHKMPQLFVSRDLEVFFFWCDGSDLHLSGMSN